VTDRRTRRSWAYAALLSAAACDHEGARVAAPVSADPSTPIAAPEPTTSPAQPVTPLLASQSWHGAYTCAQGVTEAWLRVVRVTGAQSDVIFEFSHAESGASGSFRMRGEHDGKTVRFEAGEWILQPGGYASVDLEGSFTDAKTLRGRVLGPGCTTFVLKLR
jgi:hypothetical protein